MYRIIFLLLISFYSLEAKEQPNEHKLRLSFKILEECFSLNNRTKDDLQKNEWLLDLAEASVTSAIEFYQDHHEFQLSSILTLIVEGNFYLRTERFNLATQKLLTAKQLCEQGERDLENKTPFEICEQLLSKDPKLPSLYSLVLHHLGQIPVYDKQSTLNMDHAEKYLYLATEIRKIIDNSDGRFMNVPGNNQEVGDYVIFIRTLGYVYLQKDQLDKALKIYTELAKIEDPFNQLMTHRQLIKIYPRLANKKNNYYLKAMESARICLEVIEQKIGNYTRAASVYRDIGHLYYDPENPYRNPEESYRILALAKNHCPCQLKHTARTVREELSHLLNLLALCELEEATKLRWKTTKTESLDSLKFLTDTESHIKSYESMGDLYLEKKCYIKASAFYSNGLSLANSSEKSCRLSRKLYETELAYLNYPESLTFDAYTNCIQAYKSDLNVLREETLRLLNHQVSVESIYAQIAEKYRSLVSRIVSDLFDVIGPPPNNNYAFIGFGSFGRTIPTPYSDLEFAILISDDHDKPYFRTLSTLFHLRINALCEAPISAFEIEEMKWLKENDCPSGRGFMLDPWNVVPHIPLNETFELIGKPHDIARIFKLSYEELDFVKKSTLYTHNFILGNPTLQKDYQNEVDKILDKKTRNEFVRHIIKTDTKRYYQHLGHWLEQRNQYSLKRDFYRPFMNVLDTLAIQLRIHSATPWQIIDKLYEEKIIDGEFREKLLNTLEKIGILRLQTFAAYQKQNHIIYPYDQFNEATISELLDILIAFQQKIERLK